MTALTSLQEGLLFHNLKNPAGDFYFEQLSLEISGFVDISLFEQAWNIVVEINGMLRTVFRWEKIANPIQVVLKTHRLCFRYFDPGAGTTGAGEARERLEALKAADRSETFDLREVPFRVTLCRIAENRYEMILSSHHILFDGWSNGIILKDFFNAYNDLTEGKVTVRPVRTSFKEFIRWHRRQDTQKRERFWKEYFRGIEVADRTELPVKRRCIPGSQRKAPTPGTVNHTFRIAFDAGKGGKENLWDGFIRTYKITPAALLYSAWGMLLQKYVNRSDVIFGTTVSGRSAQVEGIEEMVGLFINTVPLRFSAGGGRAGHRPVKEILADLNRSLQAREAYEHTPLVEIYRHCGCRPEAEPFDSLVVVENYPLDVRRPWESGPLSVVSYSIVESTHYDLTVVIRVTESIEVEFLYREEVFDTGDIRRLGAHFTRIIRGILENPRQGISNLELLSGEERRRILEAFNDTGADYPRDKTLYGLFEQQAARFGDRVALVGNDRFASIVSITYNRLNERAGRLAHLLWEKGVRRGDIVAIKMERSVEMVVGIFGILKAGAAYLPIDPHYPKERINYMLADSSAKIIDTNAQDVGNRLACSSTAPGPSSLAYIIYTSGSTGKPRGVMVEHRSVINILTALHKKYPLGEPDTCLLKTPFIFDVSVTELFGWFLGGGRLGILETGAEKDPGEILDTIERSRITHINFVPSMFNVFVGELGSRNRKKLFGLKYIFLAGEALLPGLANRFRQLNTGIVLENIYGPTEGTVYAAGYSLAEWDGTGSIPIGKPLQNTTLHILDRDGRLQPVGIPGELCISGTGVARGYLNNPGLTAEKFVISHLSLVNSQSSVPLMTNDQCPMTIYRTGDSARWLPDGNIEFSGRIDHQVKIRGFRIEPGEIETLLMKHPGVKEAVVAARGTDGEDKYLCAYVVPDPDTSNTLKDLELKEYLAPELPDYMIPSYFVSMKRIPLTPGGKIDRNTLPAPRSTGAGGTVTPPGNESERGLARIWAEVLAGRDAPRVSPGMDDSFFDMGGHSLKAMALSSKIHKAFDVKVPVPEIFRSHTPRKLAEYIRTAARDKYTAVGPVEEKEYYSLSSAQKRLYILHQGSETGTRYNMSAAVQIEGTAGKDRVEEIFGKLIQRHESFRTSFELIGSEPVQRVHRSVEFEIEYFETQDIDRIAGRFVRPFELSEAPLLRVALIKVPGDRHTMVVDMHHIVSDETSMEILEREFRALAAGEELPQPVLRYRDFSAWQNRRVGSPYLEKQGEYWLNRFQGDIPVLNMPLDFPRPPVSKAGGHSISFETGSGITRGLRQLAAETETTLFMVSMAAYNILLSKYSGREDIIVGTPIAGRGRSDLGKIVGLFANILPMRNRPEGHKSVSEFLEEVKTNALDAYENQEYPFEALVWDLKLKADPGRSPLFDTAFVLRKAASPKTTPRPYEIRKEKIHNELILVAVEGDDTLSMVLEYSTELFKESTARKLSTHYIEILEQIVGHGNKRLNEIKISHGLTAAAPDIIPDDRGDFEI